MSWYELALGFLVAMLARDLILYVVLGADPRTPKREARDLHRVRPLRQNER